jgi:hypothetical protein
VGPGWNRGPCWLTEDTSGLTQQVDPDCRDGGLEVCDGAHLVVCDESNQDSVPSGGCGIPPFKIRRVGHPAFTLIESLLVPVNECYRDVTPTTYLERLTRPDSQCLCQLGNCLPVSFFFAAAVERQYNWPVHSLASPKSSFPPVEAQHPLRRMTRILGKRISIGQIARGQEKTTSPACLARVRKAHAKEY